MTKLIIEDGVLLEFRGRDKHVEIPKGVVEIEREAFANHRGLQSVTIPAGVLEIGEYAFSGCKNLERVTLPEGLEIIGAGAFCGCSALRSIRLPRSVKEIGFSAFRHCEVLESIVIPAGVSVMGEGVFDWCEPEIFVETATKPKGWAEHWIWEWEESNWEDANKDNALYEALDDQYAHWGYGNVTTHPVYDYVVEGDKLYLTRYKGQGGEVVVPTTIEGKTVVGIGAVFARHQAITSITLPDTIGRLEDYAFYDCRQLSALALGAGVRQIGHLPLALCHSLRHLSVAEGNPTYYSQDNCIISREDAALVLACIPCTLPATLTSVDSNAFHCCYQKGDLWF